MIYIGIDDTDTLTSRGTGHLARDIAAALTDRYRVLGVTRHQLLEDPRVPCTKKNSAAVLHLADGNGTSTDALLAEIRALMLADFQPGSDPGLCVARAVPEPVTAFGRRTQRALVTRDEALTLARAHSVPLLGLGGDESGVIGALAAVGLAVTGDDGRYVLVGRIRELRGLQPVAALLEAGVEAVQTPDGDPVTEGDVLTDKLRPAHRDGRPVAVVVRRNGHWLPLKLD
jgi:tRNA(Ile2) C34 agmatinyltransferase TiaS